MGNLNETLKIDISFEHYHHKQGWPLADGYITGMKDGGDKYSCFDDTGSNHSSYRLSSYTLWVPANKFKQGWLYFFVYGGPSVLPNQYHYIKNVTLSISFDLETEE